VAIGVASTVRWNALVVVAFAQGHVSDENPPTSTFITIFVATAINMSTGNTFSLITGIHHIE
jgi:hypothetical protein